MGFQTTIPARAHRQFTMRISDVELSKTDIDRLTMMPVVSDGFLALSPLMMQSYHPKRHAEFRRVMAYLTTLKYQQARAWQIEILRADSELEYIRATLDLYRAGQKEAFKTNVQRYLKNKGL